MPKDKPRFETTLSEQELMGAFSVIYPLIYSVLQSYHPETPFTGDDLLSFFGLCSAAVIDNDSLLTTPRQVRLGAETAAVHSVQWAQRLRAMHSDDEPTFLQHVMEEDRARRAAEAGSLN